MNVENIHLGKILNNIKSKVCVFFNRIKSEKKYLFSIAVAVIIVAGLIFPGGDVHAASWGESIAGVVLGAISPIIYFIFYVFLLIAYAVAWIGADVINITLAPSVMNSVLNLSAGSSLYQAWSIFRDIANLLFILILLLIAFGTIFRSNTYNIKKSLPTLILVAFLINFSAMITGLFIDFTNILMYGIFKMMCPVDPVSSLPSATCFQDFSKPLWDVVDAIVRKYLPAPGAFSFDFKDAAAIAIAAIFVFIYGLVLIALGVFFLIRIAAFALLIVLSPLAFFGEIAPGLKGISSKWWDNLLQYAFFGPIAALLLYVSALMARNSISVPTSVFEANPEMSYLQQDISMIVTNIIPLIFLFAIIPITKSMGIAGADAVMDKTVGFGTGVLTGAVKYAGNATDRYLARGAGMKGSERPGFMGELSRRHAWARNKMSYTSPGAIKRAYKAQKAEQEHDYDRATGRMRDTYSSTIEGKKSHHEDIVNRNEVARRIKDFATKNGDEIVDMYQDATDITEKQVLLRMAAEEGKSYKLASTQQYKHPITGAMVNYTEDAEGYNKFYNEQIKPQMSESEAAKLGGDIGDLENKKGNKGLVDLGHYDTAHRKWAVRDYRTPREKTDHETDILKTFRRSNALSTAKDLRASTFVDAGGNWNDLGTKATPTLLSKEWVKHLEKIKPEETKTMWEALNRKGAGRTHHTGPPGPLNSEDDLFIELTKYYVP